MSLRQAVKRGASGNAPAAPFTVTENPLGAIADESQGGGGNQALGDETLARQASTIAVADWLTHGQAAAIFGEVDTDHNGTISFSEFQRWLKSHAEKNNSTGDAHSILQEVATIQRRWQEFDESDGNGELNLEEFENVLRQMVIDGIAKEEFWEGQQTKYIRPPRYDFGGRLQPFLWNEGYKKRGQQNDLRDGDTWQCRALEYFLRIYAIVFLVWGHDGVRLDAKIGLACEINDAGTAAAATDGFVSSFHAPSCTLGGGLAAKASVLITHFSTAAWFMTAWPIFHQLCMVYRSIENGGPLARLMQVRNDTMKSEAGEDGVQTALLPEHIFNRVRTECFWYTVLFSIKASIWLLVRPLSVAVYTEVFVDEEWGPFSTLCFAMYSITGALSCIITMLWAQSMRLATGLINARIDRIAATVRACGGLSKPPDDVTCELFLRIMSSLISLMPAGGRAAIVSHATWDICNAGTEKVAKPAIHLARTTLPVLSQGWGRTLVMVWIGYLAFTIGWLAEIIAKRDLLQGSIQTTLAWYLKLIFMLVSAGIPIAFANAPAHISTRCDSFKNNLAMMRGEDIIHSKVSVADRVDALFNMLDHVNNRQGIGFIVAYPWYMGWRKTVIDKKYIFEKAFKVYSVIGMIMPYMLHQLDDSTTTTILTPDGYGCPTGWINGHGTCFGMFDKTPLGWTEAERECQAFGASLARIDSRMQNDYVYTLMNESSIEGYWIGLNNKQSTDAELTSEGWQWSSSGNKALQYENWAAQQPNGEAENTDSACCLDCLGSSIGDSPSATVAIMSYGDYSAQWMDVAEGERGDDGLCKPFKRPYICSIPVAPMAATGGSMFGCIDGHWATGMAHIGNGLAPTAFVGVRNKTNIDASLAPTQTVGTSTGDIVANSAAECQALVRTLYPEANAAQYSNTGGTECLAVFNASGVIFNTTVQTCIFDPGWGRHGGQNESNGHRRLEAASTPQWRSASSTSASNPPSPERSESMLDQALEAQLEALHKTHDEEISELKAEVRELQATLRLLLVQQIQLASSHMLDLHSNK